MYLECTFWLGIRWAAPEITLNMGLCKGDVDEVEGLMSEETLALLLLEPCQMNAGKNYRKSPEPITNTQFEPDEQLKTHDPDEATSEQAS